MTDPKIIAKHIIQTAGCGIILAGSVLVFAPFLIGFPLGSGLITQSVAIGALMLSLGVMKAAMAYDARSISVANILLGLLAIATPWLLHAQQYASYTATLIACGITAILLACLNLTLAIRFRSMGHAW